MPEQQAPFYERHPWKSLAAIVALLGGLWAVTGAPSPWKIVSDLASTELPATNTMVVLDASDDMGDRFGRNTTKLDVARRAVARFTLPVKNQGLALRAFGGSCSDTGRLLVDFGTEHGDDIRDASAEQRPRGRSNLVNTVRAAIDDFADADRFPDRGSHRIVVFAGTVDECAGSGGAREIREDMKQLRVQTSFKFIGLKVAGRSRERLLSFKQALGRRAQIAFVDRASELPAVAGWLERETLNASECADEVDNDGDGSIDGDDPECASGTTEAPQQPTGECADGVDNDGDGNIDGDDPECASGTTEGPQQPTGECADGIDNDGDGNTDGDDVGCRVGVTEASA